MTGIFRILLVVTAAVCLAGCSLFGDDKPKPTEIEIKPAPADAGIDFLVTASPLANPGLDQTPSPMVLRLYQLKGDTAFVNANFRQLWEEDEKTLGATLLGKAEVIVQPGGVQRITAKLPEGTVLVAVVVGFRDYASAKWRAMVPVQGEKTLKLKATIKTLSVDLGPQD